MRDVTEGYWRGIGDLSLYYQDYAGDQQQLPLLCLHGLTRNSRDFGDFCQSIATDRRIICPDMRGRGNSEHCASGDSYNLEVYVQDVWSLLDHLQIDACIVIGTSMGGLMGMLMAAWQPQRVAGLVLNDVGPEVKLTGLQRIADYLARPRAADDLAQLVERLRSQFESSFVGLSDEQWCGLARQLYRQDSQGRWQPDFDVRIGQAVTVAELGLWPLFDSLGQLPMLLVYGDRSELMSEAIVEQMQSHKADLQVACIDGRGHAPFLNEDNSLRAIGEFICELA